MTTTVLDELSELYTDNRTCAQLVGLSYIEDDSEGIRRHKQGKGFSYRDSSNAVITDKAMRQRIAQLVVPPAWNNVWICPSDKGHILATGIDDRGRKQYIYHPKWRTVRDLIKFYRLLVFAKALPTIRALIDKDLNRRNADRSKILACMLWLLDNTYLRIGSEIYLLENESVGLTTLTSKHIIIAGTVSSLSFKAKSGKYQQISFDNKCIATVLQNLVDQQAPRLFSYADGDDYHAIESGDINTYLRDVTNLPISAKDFRTWGGTLLAFDHLVGLHELPGHATPKSNKAAIQAVDAAASVLGNTRSIAKASYVHPHILEAYTEKNFTKYYKTAHGKRSRKGLDKRETELVCVLEQLFEDQFTVLKKQ